MKTVPLLAEAEGQPGTRPVRGSNPRLIQGPVVVPSETFVKTHRRFAVGRRSIGQLVTRPVVHSRRNIKILVDVERGRQPLRKYVDDVVIGIRPVIKVGTKRRLPLLSLHHSMRVRIVRDEAFEVQFAHACYLRASLEIRVREIANAIRSLQKSHRRIEVRANLSMLAEKI